MKTEAIAGETASAPLHYASDQAPGIRRMRCGGGFSYVDAEGQRITDAAERRRLRELVIPPAWQDVWISPDPRGHLLATGRDSKGRKQYIYHPLWHELRSQDRFAALLEFSSVLPRMRAGIDRHLRLPALSRERVLALVVRLLETTLIRIGNREYAKDNDSYGLTTLRRKHVRRDGNVLRFSFRGKSGKEHSITLNDRRAANVLRHCESLPGRDMFQYVDAEGVARSIQSQDVNDYLRALCGPDFTAKDLRTWGGTVVATRALLEAADGDDTAGSKEQRIKAAVKAAASALGNTVTVARRHYIHPAVLAAYEDGTLQDHQASVAKAHPARHLSPEEQVVVRVLRSGRRKRERRAMIARSPTVRTTPPGRIAAGGAPAY